MGAFDETVDLRDLSYCNLKITYDSAKAGTVQEAGRLLPVRAG
jgi:hypothetical protein